MTTTTKSRKSTAKRVEFTCHAPEASSVFVAGTFNDWNPQEVPLERREDGHWQASLDLKAGRYEYKYVVDNEWICRPGCEEVCPCPGCVWNEHGTMNRVLEVSELEGSEA